MKKSHNNKIKYFIAGVAVILLLIVGYWYMQMYRPAPYEPGKTIEATSVVLDGNAGE